MRKMASCQKAVAEPQSAVMTDHRAMQTEMILIRLRRSAALAMGMPKTT